MHLPDGILSGHAEAAAGVVAVGGVAAAAKVAARQLPGIRPGRVAAVTAAVFAGQMLNFPVAQGTSGHLLGAALAVALLGPALGVLSVTAVIVVQALAFADGGTSSLGLNVVNMALVPGVAAWLVLRRGGRVELAALLSVLAAALAFSAEHALAGLGTADPSAVAGHMLLVHLAIGAGEVVLTVAGVALARRLRPVALGVAALAAGVLVAPWASASPDGLERVALDRGLASLARTPVLESLPLAGYELDGVASPVVSVALAAAAGVLLVGALVAVVERTARLRLARARHP
ncbi:MAG: energy-coupling factor ABC transporter permease [Acidimicrobiia bacterium]|nr:energy-coupling factor ABC transporter permease [Acidimicrobiia bacterium]